MDYLIVVIAGFAAYAFGAVWYGIPGSRWQAVSGLGLGLFIAGSYLALNYAFAKRPLALSFIDIGRAAGSATVIAVALDALI